MRLSFSSGIPVHRDFPRTHYSLFNNCMAINFLSVICKESYGCRPIGGNPKLHCTCSNFTRKQLQIVQIVTSEFLSFTNKIYRERARLSKRLHCLQVQKCFVFRHLEPLKWKSEPCLSTEEIKLSDRKFGENEVFQKHCVPGGSFKTTLQKSEHRAVCR